MKTSLRLGVVATFAFFGLALARGNTAMASCGVETCPYYPAKVSPNTTERSRTPTLVLPQTMQFTKFSHLEGSGHYFELILRGEYRGVPNWTFGATVPAVLLKVTKESSTGGKSHTGLGNAVIFSQRQWQLARDWSVRLGGQIELPIGADADGIASDHFEGFPHAGVNAQFGKTSVYFDAGFRFAIEGSHQPESESSRVVPLHNDEESANELRPHFVNPHEDRELNYRIGAETQLWSQRIRPAIEVIGIQVLSSGATANTFMNAKMRWSASVTESLWLVATGEVPLASQSRYDWRVGLGVQAGL